MNDLIVLNSPNSNSKVTFDKGELVGYTLNNEELIH